MFVVLYTFVCMHVTLCLFVYLVCLSVVLYICREIRGRHWRLVLPPPGRRRPHEVSVCWPVLGRQRSEYVEFRSRFHQLEVGTTVFRGTRNFEPSRRICPLPWNLYVFFCGIQYWPRGQIRHILVVFRWPYCMYTWFRHEIHDCRLGHNGKNVETVDLRLSEIFQVYLVDNCISQLQLLATNTAYLFGFRGGDWLITICGKFAAVSCGIWQTGPRNLEKFAAENSGP